MNLGGYSSFSGDKDIFLNEVKRQHLGTFGTTDKAMLFCFFKILCGFFMTRLSFVDNSDILLQTSRDFFNVVLALGPSLPFEFLLIF